MCDLSVAVRYIYAWPYDREISKYKKILLALCHNHSVDVLATIYNMLLLLSVSLIITV